MTSIASTIISEKSIQRLRPCNNEFVEVISQKCSVDQVQFCLTHAANHFALAAFWSMTFGQVISPLDDGYGFGLPALCILLRSYVGFISLLIVFLEL